MRGFVSPQSTVGSYRRHGRAADSKNRSALRLRPRYADSNSAVPGLKCKTQVAIDQARCILGLFRTLKRKSRSNRMQLGATMNMHSFLSRHSHLPLPRCAPVILATLTALAWSNVVFCGEIHSAAGHGRVARVKSLLKDNPDVVFSKDDYGKTPLHWAARNDCSDVAKLLLANHADVNAKDNTGWTPLHEAAATGPDGQKDTVELLLANHADVNAKDNFGETPLLLAAYWGYKEVVEVLLAHAADVNVMDSQGWTPLRGAMARGEKDIAELLRQHGGH